MIDPKYIGTRLLVTLVEHILLIHIAYQFDMSETRSLIYHYPNYQPYRQYSNTWWSLCMLVDLYNRADISLSTESGN